MFLCCRRGHEVVSELGIEPPTPGSFFLLLLVSVGFVTFRWKFRCVWDVQGAFGKLMSRVEQEGLSPLALAADEASARGQRSKWAEVFANFNEPGGEEMHCGGSSLCSHVGWRCYCDTLAPSYSCQCCVQVQSGFFSVQWQIKAAVVLRENHHNSLFINHILQQRQSLFPPPKKQAKRKFDLFWSLWKPVVLFYNLTVQHMEKLKAMIDCPLRASVVTRMCWIVSSFRKLSDGKVEQTTSWEQNRLSRNFRQTKSRRNKQNISFKLKRLFYVLNAASSYFESLSH